METYLLLCTFVLSALVDTSVSLSCIQCQAESDQPCTGSGQMCPPESDVCTSTLEINTMGLGKTLFRRYCGSKNLCSLTGSYSVPGGKTTLSSSCCYTNNCSPAIPVLPPVKTEKNGVSCKACNSATGEPCAPGVSLECTGDENKCISVTVSGQTTELVMSGCSTLGLCNRTYDKLDRDVKIPIHMYCANGNLVVQQSLFLLLISAALLYALTW